MDNSQNSQDLITDVTPIVDVTAQQDAPIVPATDTPAPVEPQEVVKIYPQVPIKKTRFFNRKNPPQQDLRFKKTTHNGQKVDASPLVYIVVKMIYQGDTDSAIVRVLKSKYSFSVSIPSLAAFRKFCYPQRLQEMKESSKNFKKEQTEKQQSYIDEAMSQVHQILATIDTLVAQTQDIERQRDFAAKFENLYRDALNAYHKDFENGDAHRFLEANPELLTQPERDLQNFLRNMGEPYAAAFLRYFSRNSAIYLTRTVSLLQDKILAQRASVVKIRQDVFKSFKGMSLIKELTLIFEKYNEILVSEFFPTREAISTPKFQTVRNRINSLFDEFKLKFQGLEKSDATGGSSGQASVLRVPKTFIPSPRPQRSYEPVPIEKAKQIKEVEEISREEHLFDDILKDSFGDTPPGLPTNN